VFRGSFALSDSPSSPEDITGILGAGANCTVTVEFVGGCCSGTTLINRATIYGNALSYTKIF
jgi:hypothetical protein